MSSLRFSALTLFPDMFQNLGGVVGRALKEDVISLDTVYLRDFAKPPRLNVDDHPAGGGDGMVLRADICEQALLSILSPQSYIVHLTPTGALFHHSWAKRLAAQSHIVFLCGRYAGFDHRFTEKYAHAHLSLGDFVLSGGEWPALCMMDAIARQVPGVLGNQESSQHDSHADGLLEAPAYTKPIQFAGESIPPVLQAGDHKKIAAYRRQAQLRLTALRRPDLILAQWDHLSSAEKKFVESCWRHRS